MAGKIREIMETIIQERSLDNPAIAEMTKAKFILKGIRLENFDQNSEDDPVVIEKLLQLKSQLIEPAPVPKSENIRTAYSTVPIEQEAVRDLKKQLQGFDTKVLFFLRRLHTIWYESVFCSKQPFPRACLSVARLRARSPRDSC